MRRPAEARAAIEEARKADPNLAASYVAERLLLDADKRTEEARAAYARAVELETARGALAGVRDHGEMRAPDLNPRVRGAKAWFEEETPRCED